MKIHYKIWLDQDGKAFGSGPYEILQNIEKYGSLHRAAREMGLSYSKAWKLVNMVEERLGYKLIYRKTGGSGGGGSSLTKEGKQLASKYLAFVKEADNLLWELYQKHFDDDEKN